MNRSMSLRQARCAIAALVLLLCSAVSLTAQTVTAIQESGPRDNRLNIVFVSEGYTAAELPTKFATDAVQMMEGLFASEPFKEYRSYFNVFTIAVPSADSGSDHPSLGIYRDTYFNSSFESYGLSHAVTIPPNNFIPDHTPGQGKLHQLLMQFVPDYDFVVLLVNDQRYGGIAQGRIAIVSMSAAAKDVTVHETAHVLGDLADEYESPGLPHGVAAEKPNATRQTDRSLIRWRSWIDADTPVPTPTTINPATGRPFYEHAVGLFEGANYNTSGWFRPKLECKMRAVAAPFCEVCTEALTRSIVVSLDPGDAIRPEQRSLMLYDGESTTFSIRRLQPRTHNLTVQWYLNDVAVPGATGDEFTLRSSDASPGQHRVRVQVTDASPFVRSDPAGVLRRSVEWRVQISNTAPPVTPPVLNVSTPLAVQRGEGVLIGGFILRGTESKRVIIRAIGPSLGPGLGSGGAGVALDGVLRDPSLRLFDQAGTSLAFNDNWRDTQEAEIRATTIIPPHPLESAIVTTLAPGAYTAVVSGNAEGSGIALVEVFDVEKNTTAKMANISTRGVVQTGDNVMIGGFILGPAAANQTRVIVRAIGPSLAAWGIAEPLADPTLELRDANGALVSANDDWRASQQDEIAGAGLAPGHNREAAIAAALPRGAYTAIVRGKNFTTGVALFELYNLEP
jgi:hypothetical protein